MRTLRRNKQKMFYSKFTESEPIYQRDDDGNIIYMEFEDDGVTYREPVEIGISEPRYSTPIEIYANITMSGGEAEAKEFGIDISSYDATLICNKGAYDIDETSLIWFKNEIGYKDTAKTEIEPNSADYRVVKVSESLNYTKYILSKKVSDNG